MTHRALCLMLGLALAACGGERRDETGADGRGSGEAVGEQAAAACDRPAACDTDATGVRWRYDSAAQLTGLLVGRWYLCEAPEHGGAGGRDAAGLEISQDGRWRALVCRDGRLEAAEGFGQLGDVALLDTSESNGAGFYQVNLSASNGTVIAFPSFSETPRKMVLGTTGGDMVYAAF